MYLIEVSYLFYCNICSILLVSIRIANCLIVSFLQHMVVMEDMLKDFVLGEHLLLVGNQVSFGWERSTAA